MTLPDGSQVATVDEMAAQDQAAEQEDFMAAFNSDGEEKDDKEKKPDASVKDDAGAAEDPDPGKADDGEKKEEEPDKAEKPEKAEDKKEGDDKDKKPPTAAEILEQRANERFEEAKKDDKKPEDPEKKVEPEKGDAEEQQAKAEKKQAKALSKRLKDLGVSDQEIDSDGKTVTLSEFAEEYPEVVDASMRIFEAMEKKSLGKSGFAKGEDVTKEITELKAEVAEVKFWSAVSEKHPGVRATIKTDKFKAWEDKQSALAQDMMLSHKSDDAIKVMDAYKEYQSKEKKAESDKTSRDNKKARDDLHRNTLKSGGVEGGQIDPKTEKDEFNKGFNSDET